LKSARTKEHESVLRNLFELYAHDFSEFSDLRLVWMDASAMIRYLVWRESNRFPFLIRANGDLAGFVLVQQGSQVQLPAKLGHAEFFVLRDTEGRE